MSVIYLCYNQENKNIKEKQDRERQYESKCLPACVFVARTQRAASVAIITVTFIDTMVSVVLAGAALI